MSKYTTPHLDSAALITIDVQTDVLDGRPLEIAGSSAALPAMRRLVEAFREHEAPIVHVVRLYRPDCPRTSMYEASERDFRIVLATDAISGLYEKGREELANIGAVLMTADELIERLSRSLAGAGVGGS